MPTEPERFSVTIARRVSYAPWWGGLSKLAERFVGSIPTHRDSRSGRRNAAQVRGALLIAGILTVVLWNSPWAPSALLLCFAAFVVPLSSSKRRQIVAKLRISRRKARVERGPAQLEVDAKHVTITAADERVRRLRRTALHVENGERMTVLRAGKKKVERITFVRGGGEADLDEWFECDELDAALEALR